MINYQIGSFSSPLRNYKRRRKM